MSVFRFQDNSPTVYSQQSRDYQLLCKLYDCVVNGVKFDIDTIPYILDTEMCKTNMLQLLQTKLGFFTSRKLNDDDIRYILRAFPDIIKNKGSLRAIEQAVNVYLKIIKLNSQVTVSLEGGNLTYTKKVPDHTVIVGMHTALKDTTMLKELMTYILPTGFGIYFYFYNNISEVERFNEEHNATLLFVSENINSLVRTYEDGVISHSDEDTLLTGIDTTLVANKKSNITTNFRGIMNDFISDAVEGNIIILDRDRCEYVYRSGRWKKVNFIGTFSSLPESPNEYDVVALLDKNTGIISYHVYKNNSWVDNDEIIYLYKTVLLNMEA